VATQKASLLLMTFCCSVAMGNPLNQQLLDLGQAQQQKALKMILAREKCDVVTNAYHDGTDKRGNAFWSAQCADGHSYLIMINNDASGSTTIVDCGVALVMKIHRCFTKMDGA
jgi:hypothetical protein